jgi:HD-like signal output (HDOD) protein
MSQRHILVVNADERDGRELAEQLAASNSSWKIRHANRHEAAEVILQSSRVDALIADGPLPGVPPEALFKTASSRCPAAFRLALSGNYESGPALRTMGYAHQNLWKPSTTTDVRTVLAQAFALRDLLHNDRLRLLIAQIDSLPSLPRLYLDFLDEIRKPNPSHDRLSDITSRDIGLCSKILQLVNSAFFGLPRKIDNAGEALLHLGLENVRALVLSIQVFSLFDQIKVKSFSPETLWNHSFQTGVLARNIASFEKRPTEEIETAFTAGLLHDVGKLVLVAGVPRAWQDALETAVSERIPLWQAERTRLAATHAEVGAALFALWGIPDPIVEAVAFHHEPELSGANSFCALTAVHAANELAHGGRSAVASAYLEALDLSGRFERWKNLL